MNKHFHLDFWEFGVLVRSTTLPASLLTMTIPNILGDFSPQTCPEKGQVGVSAVAVGNKSVMHDAVLGDASSLGDTESGNRGGPSPYPRASSCKSSSCDLQHCILMQP